MLTQRLPHKLSLVSCEINLSIYSKKAAFSKRIMLLVFHFIIRDGFTPKFWRKVSVKRDIIEKALMASDYKFYTRVNCTVAKKVFEHMNNNGMNLEQAIQIATQQLAPTSCL